MPLAFVETYGCQQNQADSEHIRGMLCEAGYALTDGAEGADMVVMNTCAIREHAQNRVFGNIGALTHTKKRHPTQKIIVCGCMMGQSDVADKIKNSYPHVSGTFSTHQMWQFPRILWDILHTGKRVFKNENEDGSIAEGLPIVRGSSIKAWVSIMYGCNNFCSYCIVPYVRGRERSRQPQEIIKEVQSLLARGMKDITLLGQNVNSYGKDLDLEYDFSDLLAELAGLGDDFLLRFMTSHPKDASLKLFQTMAKYDTIASHLHLPFQSGNNRVLAAMNRGYTADEYLALTRLAKDTIPDVVLSSDIIVGFPGETEAEFEDTLSMLQAVEFDAVYTFIYSPRKGTPAAEMPDPATKADKNKWFDRLLAMQNEIAQIQHNKYIGKTLRILADGRDGDLFTGRTEGGRLIRFHAKEDCVGKFVPVKITDGGTWSLTGQAVD